MGISLDAHDRRKVQRSLIQGLAKVGDQLDRKNASVYLPKQAFIGRRVDLDPWTIHIAAGFLIAVERLLRYARYLLMVGLRRSFHVLRGGHCEILKLGFTVYLTAEAANATL